MLYHYTSFEGLKGILFNKELWMTSHKFLNDTQEYIEGFNRIRKIVIDYVNNNTTLNNKQIESIHKTLNWLDNTTLFITSFSQAKDRKSQWEYGDFSLEFDENLFIVENITGVIQSIRPCLYDVNEKNRQAKLIGETYLNAFAKNPKEMDLYYLFVGYMEYLSRAKSEHFYEEEEIRLSIYAHNRNLNIFALNDGEVGGMHDSPCIAQGPIKIFSQLNLFKNPHNEKIHYKFPFNINAIKSITISSKISFKDNEQEIQKILNELNLNIPIYKSTVPFRQI